MSSIRKLLFGKYESDPHGNDQDAKANLQYPGRYMNGGQWANVASNKKSQHHNDGNLEINITLPVIIPEGKESHRKKQNSQACTLRLMLRHAKEKNKGRNHENGTANTKQTRQYASRKTNSDEYDYFVYRHNVNYELWIMNCELWIVNYELWIMNYKL